MTAIVSMTTVLASAMTVTASTSISAISSSTAIIATGNKPRIEFATTGGGAIATTCHSAGAGGITAESVNGQSWARGERPGGAIGHSIGGVGHRQSA